MEFHDCPFNIWDNPSKIDELIFFRGVDQPPTRKKWVDTMGQPGDSHGEMNGKHDLK